MKHLKPSRQRAPQPEDVRLDRLPPQLRQLVRVLGAVAAFRLVEHLGGTPLWIPPRMLPRHVSHPVCELIGEGHFAALIRCWGNQTMQLPKYDSVLRQARHEMVVTLRAEGRTLKEVALSSGYTTRQVINILHGAGIEPTPQGDLFNGLPPLIPPLTPAAGAEAPGGVAHNPFGL